jgi:hypothetical protein
LTFVPFGGVTSFAFCLSTGKLILDEVDHEEVVFLEAGDALEVSSMAALSLCSEAG